MCLWVDADLASDRADHKSTSGGLLALVGPNSFFPIGAYCNKQGAQSLSTPEAEIVALTKNLQELVYPMLGLFELLLGRKRVSPIVYEDNEATQKIIASGKIDKALAHCSRTHDLYLAWSSDQLKEGNLSLIHI